MEDKVIAQGDGFILTEWTALAAALSAIGFDARQDRALIRTYTKENPQVIVDKATGRKRRGLGEVFWKLQNFSKSVYVKSPSHCIRQWFKKSRDSNAAAEYEAGNLQLGEILDTARRHISSDPEVTKKALADAQKQWLRLRELYPAALIGYMGQMERNRQKLIDYVKEAAEADADKPYHRVDHPHGGYTLIPWGLDKEVAAKLVEYARANSKNTTR